MNKMIQAKRRQLEYTEEEERKIKQLEYTGEEERKIKL